jgi:hypothetical protein
VHFTGSLRHSSNTDMPFCLQKPEEGTEEWKLLDACMNPKEWL